MRAMTFLWLFVATAVGVGLFLLKYEVQALEEHLAATERQIADDRQATHVLNAEWAYLNDPVRLRRLAERHLGMVPLGPDMVAQASALPPRPKALVRYDEGWPDLPGGLPKEFPFPVRKPGDGPIPVLVSPRNLGGAELASRGDAQ